MNGEARITCDSFVTVFVMRMGKKLKYSINDVASSNFILQVLWLESTPLNRWTPSKSKCKLSRIFTTE